MIDDPNRFNADKSPYERPTCKFRCGRASGWGTACSKGPSRTGQCGGKYECAPLKKGDRYECTRPMRAGGPCEHGAQPDGLCPNERPPCVPRKSLREIRGQSVLLTLAFLFALIALTSTFSETPGAFRNMMVNAGGLSELHEGFTQDKGCEFCHATYGDRMHGWLKALFTSHDLSENCLQCHAFGQHDQTTHNTVYPSEKYPDSPDLGQLRCTKCHTEHKGKAHDMRAMSNTQCVACHSRKFTQFPEEHPDFAKNFPYQVPNTIRFDHAKHLNKHFSGKKFKDKAPSCTNCHAVQFATREVKPGPFDQVCAQCHEKQITDSELVLFEMPVITENSIDLEAISELCGLNEEQKEEAQGRLEELPEDGSVANDEAVPPLIAHLLSIASDDVDEYTQPVQELLVQMTEQGVVAFVEKLQELDADNFNSRLLGGLSAEQVRVAACSWITNAEYEAPMADEMDEIAMSGWRANALALSYRPNGHADPVIRAWIEYLLELKTQVTDDDAEEKLNETLLAFTHRKEGAGKCAKCHALGVPEEWSQAYAAQMWKYERQQERPYTHFKHAPHINLLGTNESCTTCHKLNSDVDYNAYFADADLQASKYISNFSPISKETCGQCHREGVVSIDCQICHSYHRDPRMKEIKELVQQMKR